MTRTRASLVLLGVFLLGAVSGVFASGAAVAYGFRHWGSRPVEELVVVKRLSRRLDLDEPQRDLLRKVAAQARLQVAQVGNEAVSQVEAILEQVYHELVPGLRPDQQKEFAKVREETKERLRWLRPRPL